MRKAIDGKQLQADDSIYTKNWKQGGRKTWNGEKTKVEDIFWEAVVVDTIILR